MVTGSTRMMGKNVGSAIAKPRTIGNVRTEPEHAPAQRDQQRLSDDEARRCGAPENPSVFSTAYSRVRSRAAMTIVLARTRRMMPMMT